MTISLTTHSGTETFRGRHPSDVLLVEDDELVRYAVRRLLVAKHHPCVAAGSVDEAQQLLTVHAPSLVLTDYNLGGRWSGIDLLVWMRRSPRLREIPAVLMTGDAAAGIRGRLDAAGLRHVEIIAKPFEPGDLFEAIGRAGGGADPRAAGPPT